MKKFIKVNMVIANILLGIYQAVMAIAFMDCSYTEDRKVFLLGFAVMALSILVVNISGKMLIQVFEKAKKIKNIEKIEG